MSKTSPHRGAILDRQATTSRRGVTLLEVLIAIGILAVGLTSVVSLVPAGRSQAARAVVLDRAGVLAANALADAATFGLLRPDALTGTSGLVVIDPADAAGTVATTASGVAAWIRPMGIFSSTSSGTAPAYAHELFTRSRDDVMFKSGTITAEDPPINSFDLEPDPADPTKLVPVVRSFQGQMTCLYGILSGTPGTLSVVVFHGRDPGTLVVTGTLVNGAINTGSLIGLNGRSPRDVLKPGVILYGGASTPRFHQAISVAFPMLESTMAASGTAYVTFSTGTAILNGTHTLTIFPDSVGLAERTFMAEPSGPYLQ